MGKFLEEYQEALHKAKHEGRQLRVGAVIVDSAGRYLILGRKRDLGMVHNYVEVANTFELPSGKVNEHESLEHATIRKVGQETGLTVTPDDIWAYLDHFDYDLKRQITWEKCPKTGSQIGKPYLKAQFNFLVNAGVEPQVRTTGDLTKYGGPRGFQWAYPVDFPSGLSPNTRRILTMPKIEQILASRRTLAK